MGTTTTRPILLASSSRYRRTLLDKVGLQFSSASPDIDETPLAGESAPQLVARLAASKAQALTSQYPEHIIIGSDQVAALANDDGSSQILGKPGNYANAVRQLSACAGRRVVFYTGLSVLSAADDTQDTMISEFEVKFRDLSLQEIEGYIKKEEPFDCAGSFKSEGLGITLFEYLRGDDPNSLIGLPLIALLRILRQQYAINPLTTA